MSNPCPIEDAPPTYEAATALKWPPDVHMIRCYLATWRFADWFSLYVQVKVALDLLDFWTLIFDGVYVYTIPSMIQVVVDLFLMGAAFSKEPLILKYVEVFSNLFTWYYGVALLFVPIALLFFGEHVHLLVETLRSAPFLFPFLTAYRVNTQILVAEEGITGMWIRIELWYIYDLLSVAIRGFLAKMVLIDKMNQSIVMGRSSSDSDDNDEQISCV